MGVTGHPTRISELALTRRGRTLVRDLSVEVQPGETLAVVGPSGAGKTTLLRVVAGLTPADTGRVHRPPGGVAMVFQDPRLLPWRTARQNVELVLGVDARARAEHWLDRVGLSDALDLYPAALSGGMRQRVAIARALAYEAPLVLVDEPFAHLAPATAQGLRTDLVGHLAELGTTTFWVTHDPVEAGQVATRVLELTGPPEGRWCLNGPALDESVPDAFEPPTPSALTVNAEEPP